MLDALKNKLKLAANLPSPPASAVQVIQLASDPNSHAGSIASVIGRDPSLTAKIMRIANSAMYSRGRQSTNLRQAVTLLGLNAATTLALSFTLVTAYRAGTAGGIGYPGFWRRSILCASAARRFAKCAGLANAEDVFLGALLQDIAVLAIDRVQPGFYASVPESATHAQLIAHERAMLGSDHAAVGGWLLQHWKLPDSLAAMAESSHDPTSVATSQPHARAARCVALSSECAEVLMRSGAESADWSRLASLAQTWLDLDAESLAAALNALVSELPEIETLFDTSLMNPESANAILEQARELLMLRGLQALDQVHTLKESADALTERTAFLEDKHRRDSLTGLYNRRHLDEVLTREFEGACTGRWPLSLVFIDLDHFKSVNDTYGHAAGDTVLVATARTLLSQVRESDCVARYGGEEFVIVLPGLDPEGATLVCERLLARLRETRHEVGGARIGATASLGLASHTPAAPLADVSTLIHCADRAVYAAKAGGRNQIVRYSERARPN